MKKSRLYLPLLFIFASLMFSACGIQKTANGPANNSANGGNSVAGNTAPANQSDPDKAKSTHAFPEMPANIMKAELKSLDGTSFTLKQYEGKVILINLWATWCGPCRMEMPGLIQLETDYKDKGVMVIGLDVDPEPEEMVKAFVEKQGLNYKIAWSTEEVHNGLLTISRAGVIPQSFMISQDGRLAAVYKGYGPNTLKQMRTALDDTLARTTE